MATYKFIVSASALLRALNEVKAGISNNPVVPILSNFLFDLQAGKLIITACDLETTIQTELAVESKTDGRIAVPARVLLDTLKGLPDQPITFSIDEDEFIIEMQSANGRYKIAGENAADFPRVPVVKSDKPIDLPASVLVRAINKTLFAVSSDDLRPAMTGVLLQLATDRITFVATDGHRLLRYRRLDVKPDQIRNIIVPRKAVGMLKAVLPTDNTTVRLQFNQSNAFFSFNHLRLVCRLIDERYPDYENVIPVSNPNQLIVDRVELLNSVRRVSCFSNRTTHQLRFRLTGSELTVAAQDLDFGNEASEKLACQYDGEDLEIGFNSKFLLEMLSNLDSVEIRLALSNPNRAGVLTPTLSDESEDTLMLVMPVMLTNY